AGRETAWFGPWRIAQAETLWKCNSSHGQQRLAGAAGCDCTMARGHLDLEVTSDVTVGAVGEVLVSVHVDIVAYEVHAAITQDDVDSSRMQAFQGRAVHLVRIGAPGH